VTRSHNNPNLDSTSARWMRSRTTLVLAAVFLALVVAAAIGVAISHHGSSTAGAASTQASSTTAPPGQVAQTDQGFAAPSADLLGRLVAEPNNPFGQPLGQQAIIRGEYTCPNPPNCPVVDPPAGVMWQEVRPFVLPFSTSDGPAALNGTLAVGYTRTPQGAALAGEQIAWRATSSKAQWSAVAAQQMAGTPDEIAATQLKSDWDYTASPSALLRASAFRLTSWDGADAVVQYAVPDANSTWFSEQLELVWQDGDWRLRAAPDAGVKTPVVSLVGWTQW